MLVLSRYKDESIYIGDDVVVTIVDVRGDRVRLGIQAPPNVSVHRQEVYDAIAREKGLPSQSVPVESKKSSEPPLGRKLAQQRSKALPIEIDTPGVGGFGSVEVLPGN